MEKPKWDIQTRTIHGGDVERYGDAVILPIFQSSTYLYQGQTEYEALRYIRLNNTPNHRVLHSRLADLESGEAGLVTASGMAAISAALLAVVANGDHMIAQGTLYGGTYDLLVRDFPDWGISCDFANPQDPGSWESLLRPTTKLFYVETLSNPLMQIPDLGAVTQFCREHDLLAVTDNTFATPVNFRPLEHGFDVVIHSCTKYLNGHTDIVGGAVIGKAEFIARANRRLLHLGGCLDPHACFLLERGLKTLALRVHHQNRSALEISRFLSKHPQVERVNYPGLEGCGDERSKSLFEGFGGMLSFELRGGGESVHRFFSTLTIPLVAPSLGGVETLITQPAVTSHSALSAEERESLGIRDSLVRLSVGIEATADLIADLGHALDASAG